jgi:hypothetical protein
MKRQIPYAQLGLPVLFLLVTSWYLIDSYKASATTENLLLILPAGIVVLCLSLWIFVTSFRASLASAEPKEKERKKEEKEVSVIGAMIILAAYIISMDWIGFDVATFLFIGSLMFLQGERRIAWLTGFSFIFAFLVALFFEYMIPYPMPMLLGKEFIERLI